METYNKLRKKVYGLIYPDGIPLEFGCHIKAKHRHGSEIYGVIYNIGEDYWYDACDYAGDIFDSFDTKLIENLGPDLTLLSILRALERKLHLDTRLQESKQSSNKSVWTIRYSKDGDGGRVITKMIIINIHKQPKERSTETLKSILDLLD